MAIVKLSPVSEVQNLSNLISDGLAPDNRARLKEISNQSHLVALATSLFQEKPSTEVIVVLFSKSYSHIRDLGTDTVHAQSHSNNFSEKRAAK